MRIGMVSALSVLLPLICSSRPAAQFNPASPQSVHQDESKPTGGGLRVEQVSSTAEQALDSTLVTLKEGRASQSHLSQELAHVMMRLAENNHQPSWPVVVSFTDKLTRELISRQMNSAQIAMMRECIVEVMRITGTSNAGLASRLQQTLIGIGIESSKTQLVVRDFIAVREAVQGPDDSPLAR
ncbi:MAG TPA: hypothetical protein VJW94_07605 [Candidatus Acidoferrum sp.]|nr:hypothetical protein [Candidatus Acidoferrum sp.]